MKIATNVEKPKFKPVTVMITFETLEELGSLTAFMGGMTRPAIEQAYYTQEGYERVGSLKLAINTQYELYRALQKTYENVT